MIHEVPLADDARTPTSEELGPEPSSQGDLGPIEAGARIAEMDILRGFALLGICVINLQDFLGPGAISGDSPRFPAWYDRTAEFFINLLGSGKFNAMFSFLFGVGFAIQMDRAAAKNASFATMYVRRLLALFLFGAAHLILLWEGDVLHVYAAIGLLLIFFRTFDDRWLWYLMVLTLVGPIAWVGTRATPTPEKQEATAREAYARAVESIKIYGRGDYLIPPYMPLAVRKARDKAHDVSLVPATIRVTAEGSYRRGVAWRVKGWVREMRKGSAIFWAVLGTTLIIGFLAGRRGIFQDIPGHLPFIRWVTIVSGVIGLGLAAVYAIASLLARPGEQSSTMGIVAILGYIFGRPFLCAFYMGVIILLAQTERFRRLLAPLALVGRMPLTNYLVHSVVFALLFYGYGLGLLYRIGPALSLPIAFTLYGIQVAYSNWWMKRFQFGPMEWVWRTLTYGNPASLR